MTELPCCAMNYHILRRCLLYKNVYHQNKSFTVQYFILDSLVNRPFKENSATTNSAFVTGLPLIHEYRQVDGPGNAPVRQEGAFNGGTTDPILRDTVPDFAHVPPLISGAIDAWRRWLLVFALLALRRNTRVNGAAGSVLATGPSDDWSCLQRASSVTHDRLARGIHHY